MNAVVDQPPAIHDEDMIRVHGRGNALGNDNLGLALNFLVEAPAQVRFAPIASELLQLTR